MKMLCRADLTCYVEDMHMVFASLDSSEHKKEKFHTQNLILPPKELDVIRDLRVQVERQSK